jgi:putative ABC transport system permease protein
VRAGLLLSLILKEALHRKGGFLLATLAVAAAVAACVALSMAHEAAQRETRRVTRDLGFNLQIVPRGTDLDDFWLRGYSELTLPEDALHRLAAREGISYNHLVGILEGRAELGGRQVLLTGLSPELSPPGREKPPMGFAIAAGTLHLGHEVARRLGLEKGDTLELGGETFRVERSLPETGSGDDVRAFGLLSDIQRVLGLEGKISRIRAIDCLCLTAAENPLAILRAELEGALPEAMVLMDQRLADARARQRRLAERHAARAMPFLIAACAAWIFVLALLNVRERGAEIGILRALGQRSALISGLILGKALLIGGAGAALGYGLGTWLALRFGPEVFQLTAGAMRPAPALLVWAVLGAPLFAAAASYVPAMLAVARDPATALRGE